MTQALETLVFFDGMGGDRRTEFCHTGLDLSLT
jgi:hypothetical protein